MKTKMKQINREGERKQDENKVREKNNNKEISLNGTSLQK